MRKVVPREGEVSYYHVYSKNLTSNYGVVFKLQGTNLECLTKGISLEKMISSCGLHIEEGILKSNENYISTKISLRRAMKKVDDSKNNFSFQYQ